MFLLARGTAREPPGPRTPRESPMDLKEKLRAIVAEVSEIDDIPDQTPFAELGIDSMMALEVVSAVERQYKVSVPEEELRSLTNFQSVYDLFATKIA
jgi:acyl carrier protein